MQEWCRQHCTRSEQKALEEAGLFHEFLASSIYKDDVFEYMHVHIPKSVASCMLEVQGKLVSGSGWEPHILLLRRPHSRPVLATPPAEKLAALELTPEVASPEAGAAGGAAEPAVSAAGAAGAAQPAVSAAGAAGAAKPAVLAASAAGAAKPAVLAAGAAGAAKPAVSAADAVGGAAEPAVSAACTAGEELFAFSRCKSVPLDVRLAAQGLSIKLFPHQVPELMAIMQGIQEVHAFAKDLPAQTCIAALTRAAVILRGIRGEAGVTWARHQILLDTSGCKHVLVEVPAGESKNAWLHAEAQIFLRLGRELLKAHGRVEAKRESWASHREKRHAKFSGAHFLKALRTPEGSRGAARLSKRLATLMRKCLKVNPRPWTDRDTRELLECSSGNLPLCVESAGVSFAAWYNSINAGFTWLLWAQLHDFIPHVPFGDETFAVALLGQSTLAKEQLTNAGSIAEITSDREVEGSMGKLEGRR